MDEQDFAKAEIAKEKKQKLKNLKKNSSLEEFFCRAVALEKIRRIFEFRENEGVLRPPSRSLVKSKITPPNPLVLKDFFLDQKKKEIGQKRLYVYKVDTNTKK